MRSSVITVPHAMFARSGGKSSAPYDGLNLSYGVGDSEGNVSHNRGLIKQKLGIASLHSCTQVHGNQVRVVEQNACDEEVDGFDALISNLPGTGLLIQQADCQAALLHDPIQEAIGAVHCGWRGSVLKILQHTVAAMEKTFNSCPADLRAVISPSLGPCCAEFINYREELPVQFHQYQIKENHFDFWRISRDQLRDCGLCDVNIETMSICTACSAAYFSYRRAKKSGNNVTGRNGSLIALPLS